MSNRFSRGSRWTQSDIDKAKKKKLPDQMSVAQYQKATTPKILETDIQQKLIEQLGRIPYRGRFLVDYFYAVPNGGYRAKRTAAVLQAEGVKRGVPDLHCFIAKAPYHSLYIEMKTETGDLTDSQEIVIPMLREQGHKVVICRSVNSALTEIFKYLGVSA